MITWLTQQGEIYASYEEETIPTLEIKFYSDNEFNFVVLSNNLPKSISIIQPQQTGENIYSVYIKGTLPKITEETQYNFCLRLNSNNDILDATYYITSYNKVRKWSDEIPDVLELPINTYNVYKFVLENANGNEVIKKISGALPEGMSLGEDGTLIGTVSDISLLDKTYPFTISVFINNICQEYLNKEVAIKLIAADIYDKPVWITEAGSIGSVRVNEKSNLNIIATNSTASQAIFYKIIDDSELPPELTFEPSGKITGTLTTNRVADWSFTAVCFKIVNGTYVESEPRTFMFKSNPESPEDEIIWDDTSDTLDLGLCVVGQDFSARLSAHTKSKLTITFKIVGNMQPKGIVLSNEGYFSGRAESQEIKTYIFNVQAKTSKSSSTKTCKITLKAGLGKYASKLCFCIWIPSMDEYTDLLDALNKDERYSPRNTNFQLSNYPLIDICTIRSFDKELVPLLLNFCNPEWIRFHQTEYKNVVVIDRYDDTPLEYYDVVYKTFDEGMLQWEELKNGNYNWEKKLPEGDTLIWNDEYYDSSKIQLPEDNLNPTPTNEFDITNIANIRKKLQEKVLISRLDGTYYYFNSDQTISTENDLINMVGKREDGQWESISEIENPYVFSHELNEGLDCDHDFILPTIDDIVEVDNEGNMFVKLLDLDTEVIPYWKRKEAIKWIANTEYKMGDILLYDYKYYIVIHDFTSTYVFADGLENVRKLNPSEIDMYLSKNYFPTLDLGYYNPGTNTSRIASINNLEKTEGLYYYGKTLVFDEVVAIPYYQGTGAKNVTVNITRSKWKNYPNDDLLNR